MSKSGLRLLAQDAEDLKILSAAAQDAVTRVGALDYDARSRAFTVALNRFRWESGARRNERIGAVLRFDCVLAVRSRNLRKDADDAVVQLLTVEFEPEAGEENPGGTVRLILAGGAEVRLDVEALEARLMDVSPPRPARSRPDHEKP